MERRKILTKRIKSYFYDTLIIINAILLVILTPPLVLIVASFFVYNFNCLFRQLLKYPAFYFFNIEIYVNQIFSFLFFMFAQTVPSLWINEISIQSLFFADIEKTIFYITPVLSMINSVLNVCLFIPKIVSTVLFLSVITFILHLVTGNIDDYDYVHNVKLAIRNSHRIIFVLAMVFQNQQNLTN